MKNEKIFAVIDHSILNPHMPWAEMKKEIEFAVEHKCATVCVGPYYVKKIVAEFGNKIPVCAVAGFPRGDSSTEIKVAEVKKVIEDGAVEVDVVANVSEIKNGNYDFVKQDIQAMKDACTVPIKVIIESYNLSKEEIIKMTEICNETGVDYIKTCTGAINGGCQEWHIEAIMSTKSPTLKVKASGAMTSRELFVKYIEMGVDRIGTAFTNDVLKVKE